MVFHDDDAKLDIIDEDFGTYQMKGEFLKTGLDFDNLTWKEIEERIERTQKSFKQFKHLVEVKERVISWDSFNRVLVELIRRSSHAEMQKWQKEKAERHFLRQTNISRIINFSGKKSTDIPNHLKMQLIDQLVFGYKSDFGCSFNNKSYITKYKAYQFIAIILWSLGLEKSQEIASLNDLNCKENLNSITERLRASFKKYHRGSWAGFPIGARVSSMKQELSVSKP